MISTSATSSPITIAILSNQCLVWLGLQKILESSENVPMIVLPYPGKTSDLLRAERQPDVFILDLETEHVGAITQIRESAPTSKIVLLCRIEDNDRTREAFACGVDGIILKIQPPTVVLAVIEGFHAPAKSLVHVERNSAGGIGLGTPFKKTVEADTQPPAWIDAVTGREREIIRLVGQGLSNKEIAYQLSISDSTVRHHLTSIFDKVGVPNRQKLLVHAHRCRSTPV